MARTRLSYTAFLQRKPSQEQINEEAVIAFVASPLTSHQLHHSTPAAGGGSDYSGSFPMQD